LWRSSNGSSGTLYAEAFALYQEGKFGEAAHLFRSNSERDKPSKALAERCAQFAADSTHELERSLFVGREIGDR